MFLISLVRIHSFGLYTVRCFGIRRLGTLLDRKEKEWKMREDWLVLMDRVEHICCDTRSSKQHSRLSLMLGGNLILVDYTINNKLIICLDSIFSPHTLKCRGRSLDSRISRIMLNAILRPLTVE